MSWQIAIDARTGWPKSEVGARHIRDGHYHLALGLNGPGPTPEQATAQLVEDARAQLADVLIVDRTTYDLARELKTAQAERNEPARLLAEADRVLADVAAIRTDGKLLGSPKLSETLADADRRERLAVHHQAHAKTVLAAVDAKVARLKSDLDRRRMLLAGLVLESIKTGFEEERKLAGEALARLAADHLTLLVGVQAAEQAMSRPGLLEQVLADQTSPAEALAVAG
jgi:hypothetical protein